MGDQTAAIKDTDISKEMQQDAVEFTILAIEKCNVEREIATVVKREFEKKYGPTWHCILGRKFGSFVSHETKHLIFFLVLGVNVLLFEAG
ncbi:Dynein light chain 1, cytoplasmic [Cariama cristata]|uniref:dynein light chain 2, cytoplasmic-like n=1 Tax=Cariama cristata TaxID=54380 RepID=UPI00052042CC|nr:PREDICTED: dynein light chain 2, cytoplasmic-like [Cariama cristata]KFP56244.1 Dynein light chain 1, cytoplasmic [Cariama cristata]